MTVGGLFSGIGGFELGFERAGFDIAWHCEADEFCRRVLAKHWPDVPCYGDVRRLLAEPADVGCERRAATGRQAVARPEYASRVDVLIGGFPCQDVSDAGKRVGLGGLRSGLWFEFDRCIGEFRPRIVVVENVRGLFVRGLDTVLGCLARRGYDAEWAVVRASDVGAPHRRARVFIIAYRTGPLADATEGGAGRSEKGIYATSKRLLSGRSQMSADIERGCQSVLADADCDGQHELGAAYDDHGRDASGDDADRCRARGRLDDAAESGLQRHLAEGGEGRIHRGAARSTRWPARPGEPQHGWEPPRTVASARAQSALGSLPDGLSSGLPGWRRAALAALGNAIVPQVAEVVARRVMTILETT